MGIDTSHDAWSGAYSAFHRWRCEIARVAGVPPLDLMEGFWRPFLWPVAPSENHAGTVASLFASVVVPSMPIRWDALVPDPLYILLNHSDCDGLISAFDCGVLADRLTELLPELSSDLGGHVGDAKAKTQRFINGLRRAHEAGEDLEFY